jgi:alpha-L-glutamate ligase-like protein/uncharacterized protein (TIGR02421 family)
MNFWSSQSGILGINARNLHYVQKYNSKASKRFADDKLYTKNFLQSRGIGVAKIFHLIKKFNELEQLNLKSLPEKFVVKPNHGYGGEGILVITSKNKNGFNLISGKKITYEDLFFHIASILDGRFALSNTFDQAIIEEMLEVNEEISPLLSTSGLPDLRIIVFNYVPIVAMLRVPTIESEGKANLALGAMGIGVDIVTGKTTFAYQNGKIIKKLPNGDNIRGFQIPDWENILLTTSKIQQSTNIGYLGVDLVLSKNGIKVLEVNARPGLKIQLCTRVPLRYRLEMVAKHKVLNPEQGVMLAKRLFTEKGSYYLQKNSLNKKKTIGLKEPVNVYADGIKVFLAKIDPYSEENILYEESDLDEGVLDISIQTKRMKLPFKKRKIEGECNMIISGKYLKDFLIDMNLENKPDLTVVKEINEKMILNLDKKIFEIEEKLNFMSFFKIQNLKEVQETFLKYQNFNPQFEYKPTPDFLLEELNKDLSKLPRSIDHCLMPLYEKKIIEITNKIKCIKMRDSKELTNISEILFGTVDYQLYKSAINAYNKTIIKEDESKLLQVNEIKRILENYLKNNQLDYWQVKTKDSSSSNMSVSKKGFIFMKEDAVFSENHLKTLLAHEIETHVFRTENARQQKYKLLKKGTASYLETEEGLAIYNQNLVSESQGRRKQRIFLRAIGAFMGKKMSFLELFMFGQDEFGLDALSAFKNCLRVKRGLRDTGELASFTKDTIYFTGQEKIKDFIKYASLEDLKLLYSCKCGLKDLDVLKKLDLQDPKFLPKFILEKSDFS